MIHVVVGRDPRDVIVSMKHHLVNIGLDRVLALHGQAVGMLSLTSVLHHEQVDLPVIGPPTYEPP